MTATIPANAIEAGANAIEAGASALQARHADLVHDPDQLRADVRLVLEAAARHLQPADREQLDQAEDALRSLAISLLGVKPWLDRPYTDRPELTPWTNGIGQQARRAHDLALAIRRHLGLPHRWRTRAIGTPPLEVEDAITAAVAEAQAQIISYRIGGQDYDPADVTIRRQP